MADITAASANPADVQTALNQAGPDGRVRIPAGRGLYPSGSAITPPPNCRIEGAGIGKTIFEVRGAQNVFRHPVVMSGFSAEMHDGATEVINSAVVGFVLEDFHVKNFSGGGQLWMRAVQQNDKAGMPPVAGVIRRFKTEGCRLVGNGAGFGNASEGSGGTPYWQLPSPCGKKDNQVVLEDGEILFTKDEWHINGLDSNNGFMMTVRKVRFFNTTIEAHSVQGDNRATRWTEVYDCIFDSDVAISTALFIRAGSGCVYSNKVGPLYNNLLAFDNIRSHDPAFKTRAPMFACDGTSPWDGNEDPKGWPARDQIGRGRDLGPFPSKQESEPFYVWNNTRLDGTPWNQVVVWNADAGNAVKPFGSGADIKPNRDYFIAPRPGYTPLEYPYPVAGTAPTPPVDPPPVDPPPVDPPPVEPPVPPTNQAPTVKFVKPSGTGASNELVTPGKSIKVKTQNLALEASDDVGPVRIELYIAGKMVRANVNGEKTLMFPWNTAPFKKMQVELEGVVIDGAGMRGSTGKVPVTIDW